MDKNNNIINHKIIGKNLNLFIFNNNIGKGLPLWLPNGLYIYNKIKKIIKIINLKNNYKEVLTPHIVKNKLFKISGHLDKYYNNIFKLYNKKYCIKPMNCPSHCIIFKNYKNLSYKKLPKRLFEFGTVYRKEKSGELNGLFRTINFTQDDGHILCLKKNIYKEIYKIIKNIIFIYKFFNFNKIYIRFSLSNKSNKKKINNKYIGKIKNWKKSEKIILNIKKKINFKYKTYIKYNDAAFYGPKIDFIIKDSLKRKWQLGTIQIDYNTPINFNLKYINKYNKYKYPIIIHRAYIGSIERFIGILLEHTRGNLPIWLLKIQLIIIPINNNNLKYSYYILNILKKKNIKIKIDKKKKNLNEKIKKYERLHIPYIFIIGDKEVKNNSIFIRSFKKGKIGNFSKRNAIKYIIKKIKFNL
ncbi:MAG: threonine--tRNA ligase [Candidatus Shikimatogenerans bostrichidophilus]|nr:MAG: threonine--tRNA ligase [Candidatus Shikimatogenerans bostrichidophilus]